MPRRPKTELQQELRDEICNIAIEWVRSERGADILDTHGQPGSGAKRVRAHNLRQRLKQRVAELEAMR